MGILTQNVRGFRDDSDNRGRWMSGWKQRVDGHTVSILLLQETHVASRAEATALEAAWCRCWGRTPESSRPLSFWSVTSERAAGVAVLLHPSQIGQFQVCSTRWTGRVLHLASPTERIVNVYAPNNRSERAAFFGGVAAELHSVHERLWLAGDFNCVEHPDEDRITGGQWSSGASESRELTEMCEHLDLIDCARGELRDPLQLSISRLTYWQGDNGARLDRCYVSRRHRDWIQSTRVITPHGPTDHRGVLTWIRDPACKQLRNPLAPTLYPIVGRNAKAIDREIGQELGRVAVAAELRQCSWDQLREHVSDTLRAIRRTERKRAKRQRKRADKRQRKNIRTLSDLISYVEGRVARRSQIQRGTNILERSGNSSHLFNRLTRIDQRQPIPALRRTLSTDLPPSASDADVMAAEWKSLLGTVHATVVSKEKAAACALLYAIPTEHRLTANDNQRLMARITEDEILETIATLGRHKAAGPDRLNNDFFRDRGDLLVPTLTREFNRILEGGDLPTSFAEAIIVPLPKAGDPSTATNYRPIALLQSSYKLLTKVLANRVQATLARVINDDQNGFVRGRAMANNIHLMQAILEQQYDTEPSDAAANAAVVLLDFRKAYDTLDRPFIRQVLRDFGYAEAFADLVDRLHARTSAQFLVNGELSTSFDIVTGIRQGCPLAPLLFLIAAETLKHAIDHDPRIRGIRLRGTFADHVHTLSAFVDDSVVFLERGDMVDALSDVLRRFAAVSGLQVQSQKSHAIVLNVNCTESHLGDFPIVPAGSTVPYLGVEMGLVDLAEVNWEKRCDSMIKRLGSVSQYTTSVSDRVQVVNLACLPSLLFTAKYFTPSPMTQLRIDALWRTYIWEGKLTNGDRRAHKVASEIMCLPKSMAGVGLIDYRGAMLIQAATTILTWNARTHDKYWEAFNRLLKTRVPTVKTPVVRTYPSAHATVSLTAVKAGTDLFALGYRAINVALRTAFPRPPQLQDAHQSVLQRLKPSTIGLQWLTSRKGQLTFSATDGQALAELGQLTYAQMPAEVRSFWWSCPWYDNDWIRGQDGSPLSQSTYRLIRIHTIDELRLRQVDATTFTFEKPTATDAIIRGVSSTKLKEWLCCIISSRGALPLDPAGADDNRVYTVGRHEAVDAYEWRLRDTSTAIGSLIAGKWSLSPPQPIPGTITMNISGWRQPVSFEPSTPGAREFSVPADLQVILDGHPWLQHGPTLLGASSIGVTTKSSLRTIAIAALRGVVDSQATGLSKLVTRLERQHLINPVLSAGLQSVTARSLTKQPWGVTAQQQLCKYRLTIGGLNLRDREGHVLHCPHSFCSTSTAATETHIFWECPAARAHWRRLLLRWSGSQVEIDPDDYTLAIFGMVAPQLAHSHRHHLETISTRTRSIATTVRRVWVVIVHVSIQQLWLCRNATAFQDVNFTLQGMVATAAAAVTNHLRALSTVLLQQDVTAIQGQLIQGLLHCLAQDGCSSPPTGVNVRLYFDGGARQNPGPAGSGSLIAEASSDGGWDIVWWEAHYISDTATNNIAEHTALLRGVGECVRRYAAADVVVDIVGDSQLILAQTAGLARTTTHPLRVTVEKTQQLLRCLPHHVFHHSLRSGNKMADRLANYAMDTRRTTSGPTISDDLTSSLRELLPQDIVHPWTTPVAPDKLLPQLRLLLAREQDHRTSRKRRRRPTE